MRVLSSELTNEEKPNDSRQMAGITLKNTLDAKDAATQAALASRWRALEANVKVEIKTMLLPALGSKVADVRMTVARVIAKMAVIELPHGEWPDIISILLKNIQSPDSGVRASTLKTMGYMCEELPADTLKQEQVNEVLTAVVQGMRADEPDNSARLAAVEALNNAIVFAATNFENEVERNYIMQQVCESTQCPDAVVREASLQCLVTIAVSYYEKLPMYIEAIYKITSQAIEKDTEDVAKQAIEFWCTICEEEIDIQEAYADDDEVVNNEFMKKALPFLLPILLTTLEKQDESEDIDDNAWTLAKAGGVCLGLVAGAVGDDIVVPATNYVKANFGNENWRKREAATLAFGSILDGPKLDKLIDMINQIFEPLVRQLKDPNLNVQDTSAWTISRILQFCHGPHARESNSIPPLITAANLPSLLGLLIESLQSHPLVAEKICSAIHHLAAGFDENDGNDSTSYLSPYFQSIVQALLATADRADGEPEQIARLRLSAYESLNEVVRHASRDTMSVVHSMLPHIAKKLQDVIEMQTLSPEDRQKQVDLQGLLCGVLMVMIQRCSVEDSDKQVVQQCADYMMQLFLKVFASQVSTVHEDAMLAIGALAHVVGPNFVVYMDSFHKYLESGLKCIAEHQVCSITVGVVGDICRALDHKILPYCDIILAQLLQNLRNNDLNKDVKPPIIACFGDIALAIGADFERYLNYVMPMIASAMQLSRQASASKDEDMIDFNNALRGGIFEAYSGIFQGIKRTHLKDQMGPYTVEIVRFVRDTITDDTKDDNVCTKIVGVIGDMVDTLDGTENGSGYEPSVKERVSCVCMCGYVCHCIVSALSVRVLRVCRCALCGACGRRVYIRLTARVRMFFFLHLYVSLFRMLHHASLCRRRHTAALRTRSIFWNFQLLLEDVRAAGRRIRALAGCRTVGARTHGDEGHACVAQCVRNRGDDVPVFIAPPAYSKTNQAPLSRTLPT